MKKAPIYVALLVFVFLLLPFMAAANIVEWCGISPEGCGPLTVTNLQPGTSGRFVWDDQFINRGTVIKDGDTYKMWYMGCNASACSIGYAKSSDGITWEPYLGNPVFEKSSSGWDSAHVGFPAVILEEGGTYKMWYSGTDDLSHASRVHKGYATSPDGTTWTRVGTTPVLSTGGSADWDADSLEGATVIRDGSTYKMWYTGRSQALTPEEGRIGYAASPDGFTNWVKYNDPSTADDPFVHSDPVIQAGALGSWYDDGVWSPAVIKDGSYYRMWFSSTNSTGSTYGRQTGYAYSKDGIAWRLYDGNPVIWNGSADSFYSDQATDAMVIKDGNTYKMWFVGGKNCSDDGCTTQMGYGAASAYNDTYLGLKAGVFTVQGTNGQLLCNVKGPSPLDINQLDVTGPSGFYYLFSDSDIQNIMGKPWISATPPMPITSGLYTFTVTTNNGITATQSLNLVANPIVALTDGPGGLDRSVNLDTTQPPNGFYANTTTPIFKWKPSLGDSYYYRVRVFNWERNAAVLATGSNTSAIWYMSDFALGSTKDTNGYMSVTIPANILKNNTPYQWQVEVADTSDIWSAHNTSRSGFYYFYTGTKVTSNFLSSSTSFSSMLSYRDGNTALMYTGVQGLAPWDINMTAEDAFRVKNQDNSTFFQFTVDAESPNNNALSSDDPLPFLFRAYKQDLLATNHIPPNGTYHFYIKDLQSGNSTSIDKTFQYVTVPTAYGQYWDCSGTCTTQPTLHWSSVGPTYKHRVRIIDWNFRRLTYQSDWFTGVAPDADISVQVPADTLKEWTPYHWWVEVYDSTMNSFTRSQYKMFQTYGAPSFLYATWTSGLYQWNGASWSQLHSLPPTSMVASGSALYATWGGGLWAWNGSAWSQIHPLPPTSMVASGSALYATWGGGLWAWNGSAWSQIHPLPPTNMVASSGSILYATWGSGLYQWNGASWSQLHPLPPTLMTASGSTLYATWGGGLWAWNGATWSEIHPLPPTLMTASGSALYATWGASGLYAWNGAAWSQIHPVAPTNMVASESALYATWASGLWKWDGTSWSQLHPLVPTDMVAGF